MHDARKDNRAKESDGILEIVKHGHEHERVSR